MSQPNVSVHGAGRTSRLPLSAAGNLDDLAREVWSMMNEMTQRQQFQSAAPGPWQPRVNFYETDSRYLLCVELAGMSCPQIDVHVAEHTLTISGTRPKPGLADEAEAVSVHVMEIDSGCFQRELPLPEDVNSECISAQYRQGYLWISLPKCSDEADSDCR